MWQYDDLIVMSKKDKYYVISFIYGIINKSATKPKDAENKLVVSRNEVWVGEW